MTRINDHIRAIRGTLKAAHSDLKFGTDETTPDVIHRVEDALKRISAVEDFLEEQATEIKKWIPADFGNDSVRIPIERISRKV